MNLLTFRHSSILISVIVILRLSARAEAYLVSIGILDCEVAHPVLAVLDA